jgi:hypothetical protein
VFIQLALIVIHILVFILARRNEFSLLASLSHLPHLCRDLCAQLGRGLNNRCLLPRGTSVSVNYYDNNAPVRERAAPRIKHNYICSVHDGAMAASALYGVIAHSDHQIHHFSSRLMEGEKHIHIYM